MDKLICYPLLPEGLYYASLEQQNAYYSDTKTADKNVDICEGEFVTISRNVRAWVVFDEEIVQCFARNKQKETCFNEEINGTPQEALDYLVARLWMGMVED